MNGETDKKCEEFQILIMGYIDDELSQAEKMKLEAHLKTCAACKQSLAEYKKLKEVSSTMRFKEPNDALWDKQWQRITNKLTRSISWLLIIVGIVIIVGFAIYQFIQNPGVEGIVRVGIFALFIGFFLLLISLILERIKEYKTDRYKEIDK